MIRSLTALLLCALLLSSCKPAAGYGEPVVAPSVILKDIMSFLSYRQQHVRLAADFTALDVKSGVMEKASFLQQLATGKYVPLRLTSNDSTAYYQLYPLGQQNDDIRETMQQWGEHLYTLYQMEGKELPNLNFTDLEGKTYTKENLQGKIVAVKCWFIGCVPCVKEMPALNAMVKQYRNRRDVTFLSLAFDKEAPLRSFLKAFPFDYAVVPQKETYILDTLNVNEFPTHLLINKKGRIVKVVNDGEELATALQKEAQKENL